MSTVHDACNAARGHLVRHLRRQMGSDADLVMQALDRYLDERDKMKRLEAALAHGSALQATGQSGE